MISGIRKLISFKDDHVPDGKEIILTGIPRSGTTMVCKLLSECENVIALNETMEPDMFSSRKKAIREINKSFKRNRSTLLKEGKAIARITDGKITDNAYSDEAGTRKRVVRRSVVTFDKPLSSDFILAMKHCSEFTMLIPALKERYPVYALVRNPLALFGSWSTVNVPVSRGKVSKSAHLLPELELAIQRQSTLLDKQLFILDWYFGMYLDLPQSHVMRYEDVIRSNGAILTQLTGKPVPQWQLQGRNSSQLYGADSLQTYAEALLARDGNWTHFYTRAEIEAVLKRNLTK